mgnify:FL=1
MYLKIKNASIEYGSDVVLENIDLTVKNNEKIAIVGRNGTGKTSILKAIIGEIDFTDGYDKLIIEKDNFKIGYIKQSLNKSEEETSLIDYIKEVYNNIINIENEIKNIENKLSTNYEEKLLNRYNELLNTYKLLGGYDYIKEYTLALNKFGFTKENYNKKLKEFSGGEITKISLLKLLLSKPDLLVLDEPTNHLDIDALEWLENYLKNYKNSILLVSHDRMFLDNICNVIYSIEFGELKRYQGNYTNYIKQREEEYNKNMKDYIYQQKEIKRLTDLINKFKYKPTKAKMAMARVKVLEKMNIIDKPKKESNKTFKINFNPVNNSYKETLKLINLSVGYDKELFKLDLKLERGDKLGIIGKNGIGKSTLIKTIVGEIKPLSGKVVIGENTSISYFSQKFENLNLGNTIYDEIKGEFPNMSPLEIRTLLGSFNFSNDDVFKKIKDLSGGEKVRVSLCKILNSKPNLLVLDEPTNHLDILNKETIENLLKDYKGTLVIVSHDRYLIKNVVNKLLLIEENKTLLFNFGYEEYLNKKENITTKEVITKKEKKDKREKKKDNSKEIKSIEKEINRLEEKAKELNSELLKEEVYMDYEKSKFIELQIDNLNKLIDTNMNKWENLLNEE